MSSVLAIYECGSRLPQLDPSGECPECEAELVRTEPAGETFGEVVEETYVCTSADAHASLEISASLGMEGFSRTNIHTHVYDRIERLEDFIEQQGFDVDSIDFDVEVTDHDE